MPTILLFNANRAVDLNGLAVPGARASFFNSGTSQARRVYTDPECTVPHQSPVIADGAGVFPPVYDSGDGDVAVSVTDANGVVLAGYPIDPIVAASTDETGAAAISFNPTPEIPEKDVQAAIEKVQQNIIAPLAQYGLGVTGNGPLLANLDDTGTASGFYRFDETTAGTFPAGVTKASGGLVLIFRRNASAALMLLQQSSVNRVHFRRLGPGWQPWVWLLSTTDTVGEAVWSAGELTVPQAASPANVRAGVEALAIGCKQSWQVPSRAAGSSYQNTTGRPIMVALQWNGGPSDRFQVSANGTSWITIAWHGYPNQVIIPPGHYYRLTSGTLEYWSELR